MSFIYGIWQTYIDLIFRTEQLRVNGLAQGPSGGRLVVLGFE